MADAVASILRPHAGRQWDVRAESNEWDLATIVTHLTAQLAMYTLTLVSGSARWIPLDLPGHPRAANEDLLAGLDECARALERAALEAPLGARAFHVAGMASPEGFVTLACGDLALHGWDAACSLGLDFTAPSDVAATVLARLYPWAHDEGTACDPWTELLWATGRCAVAGRFLPEEPPSQRDRSWDGIVGEHAPYIPRAWRYDGRADRWHPVP